MAGEVLALLDVLCLADAVERLAGVVAHERGGDEHPDDVTLGVDASHFDLVVLDLPGHELCQERCVFCHVLGMSESLDAERLELDARVARQLAKSLVHLQEAPGPVWVDAYQRHPDWSVFKGALEARLGLAQRLLGALPVRDITLDR